MVRIAIIGGSGVYDPKLLEDIREEEVKTSYGKIKVKIGTYKGEEIAFLARHGEKHSVPPHKINYRANIWGLYELGVERILATSAVG
ncbi:MAG TPA: S-methyl-5'-thioadenosine phosphorylase, partial [Thermococcus paralvinellae]|nr:S-methyl-5'-thioadenosine phosphorylase [Thermococcus paralvinellae]